MSLENLEVSLKNLHFGLPFLNFPSLPTGSVGKESTWNAEDPGLIPGSGSSIGEG